MPRDNTDNQQGDADDAGQHNAVFFIAHNQAHQNGNRHGNRNNEQRPRRIMHGADAGQRQTGQCQNKNKQNRKPGDCSGKRVNFPFGNGCQTLAFVADGGENNHHIVNGAA